jgi:hypothetical protein
VNFSDDLRKHAGTRGDQRESTAIFSKFSIVQANPPSLSVNNVSILSIAIIVERLHARVARDRKSRRQARVLTRGYHKELAFRTAINSSNFDYILICATKLRRILIVESRMDSAMPRARAPAAARGRARLLHNNALWLFNGWDRAI